VEADPARRKELVGRIERKLIENAARPIIHFVRQANCWQPEAKGLTLKDNSIFNSWRMGGSMARPVTTLRHRQRPLGGKTYAFPPYASYAKCRSSQCSVSSGASSGT
jgi:hypothetical protein